MKFSNAVLFSLFILCTEAREKHLDIKSKTIQQAGGKTKQKKHQHTTAHKTFTHRTKREK